MASVLNDIVDFSQLQRTPTAPGMASASLVPLMRQDPPANDDTDELSSNPEDDNEDENLQTPSSAQNSPDAVAAFTINTARNLRLTADGEKSLLQFSQLDVRSALIYQQATLIKLNETHPHHGSVTATTAQGSGAGDRLVLTDEIKNIIDYRMRLIILSPRLSRYRSLDKGLKTGPGAVLIEWLRTASGINKKYFEGEAYKELRLKVKKSSRYARSEFKDMIRRSVENKSHITVLLHDLTQHFEKWIKSDLKTPIALAVRVAFLREVYHKDPLDSFWKTVDQTLADIRHKTASGNSLSASDILVKCLDADEQKYPAAIGSASARATLTSVWQSETQSSMDEFVASSESSSK